MGSCCSSLVPKYAAHVEALLPLPPKNAQEVAQLVLQQSDVARWVLRASPSDMTAYARQMPDKLAPMASYAAKKIATELDRGRLAFAAITMKALTALVEACHENETLALYEASICTSMLRLFEHPNHELQVLAAQCLVAMLKAQEPTANTSGTGERGVGVGTVYSSTDYAKFALFYPHVLRMATRNPPSSKLHQLGAQAKELFKDRKQQPGDDAPPSEKKTKRVKDLAELDLNPNAEDASDRLKQAISLWRSRYFGLKALAHLIQYNRDTAATFSRMHEIVGTLLVNFPKSKRNVRAVTRDIHADELAKVDEAYKSFHASEEKDKSTTAGATGVAATPVAKKDEKRALNNKDDLPQRTGITLHHVQLLAYSGFTALCKVPGMQLRFSALLKEVFAWLDQPQAAIVPTTVGGSIVTPSPTPDAAQPPTSAQKKDAASAAALVDKPVAWESLFFTSHLFIDLLAQPAAQDNGSIDLLLLSLLQHMDEVGEPALSRRSSRLGDSQAPDSAIAGSSTDSADFKQLFSKKRTSRITQQPRLVKVTQIAILNLLNNLLRQIGRSALIASVDDTPEHPALCIMNFQIVIGSFLTHVTNAVRANDLLHRNRLQHASSTDSLSVSGGGSDQQQLDLEAHLHQALALSDEFLRVLTRVFPSLLIRRFYSFNDILQALTLVLNRSINQSAKHALKAALLDAAYSMADGLLHWGSDSHPTHESVAGFDADEPNLSSSTLYESLIHSVLGAIACEINAKLRGVAYKILQSVLLCMHGFGGSWSGAAYPSAALMMHASSFGSTGGSNIALVGLSRGATEPDSLENTTLPSRLNINNRTGSEDEVKTNGIGPSCLSLELPVNETAEKSVNSSDASIQFEPSPSPKSGHAGEDLRARRIPQIMASGLDVKSSGASFHSGGAGPMARLSLQDHKWIVSIIYYEITSCFGSHIDAAGADHSAFQVASSIIKPRGRGATTNENLVLSFQLLVLLLQRLPSSSTIEGIAGAPSIQQVLALQLPLVFTLLSYVRSPVAEDKFYLPPAANLRLHQFVLAYLGFVTRLLTLSVDSHWIRQQSVSLEELLQQVMTERSKKSEGAGCDLEMSSLYGLAEVGKDSGAPQTAVSEISTHFDEDGLAGILARLLVERPNSDLAGGANAAANSMDEDIDSLIASQKSLLLAPSTFDPFSLQFLLPERGVPELGLERDSSQSWAPSGRGAILQAQFDEETRIGGGDAYALGDDSIGTSTPRTQPSPGLKGRTGPASSPITLQLASGAGSNLATIQASPQPQQSVAELMAEIDQQSFASLASIAAKTTVKSQSQFDQFMAELDGPPRSEVKQPEPLVDEESKLAVGHTLHARQSSAGSTGTKSRSLSIGGAIPVETVAWSPDFDVMRPLSTSTLDLQFPQLASFDLYLHSEIE